MLPKNRTLRRSRRVRSGFDATGEILPLGGVQFPLAPLRRLLEVLMASQIRQHPGLLALFLEAAQGAFEGLSILHPDAGHSNPPLKHKTRDRADTRVRQKPSSEMSRLWAQVTAASAVRSTRFPARPARQPSRH